MPSTRLSAALALATVLALSGCSIGGSPTAASSSSSSASAGHSSASPSASADDSSDDSGTDVKLPANFPKDDVPLIDGTLAFTADLGTGWIVYVKADDFGDAYQQASGKLTSAGYSKSQEVTDPAGDVAAFTNDTYQVILTAGTDSTYGKSVGYTITKN